MKPKYLFIIAICLTAGLLNTSCFLFSDDEDDLIEDDPSVDYLSNSFEGILAVRYTSVYPEWDVTTTMNVEIEKVYGHIYIDPATLSYSGETLMSDDSKIVRYGSWTIAPTGVIDLVGEIENDAIISIDAHVDVPSDIQELYALNDKGVWVQVIETNMAETPNSDLVFYLKDALTGYSNVIVNTGYGSIIWSLGLIPNLD